MHVCREPKRKQHQMEEGGVRQQNCSQLVKETEIAAAERRRKGMTKRERERGRSVFSSHVHSHTPPGIKEHDTLNIKAVTNTGKISCRLLCASAGAILTLFTGAPHMQHVCVLILSLV